MNDGTSRFSVSRVDLDRTARDEHKELAAKVFETRVGVRGRYALDVQPIIELFATLAVGAGGSALWDFVKWGAPRVKEYVNSSLFPDGTVAIEVYRAESAGLIWEIRHRSDNPLDDFHASLIIQAVDTWELHPDTARISINLVEQRIALFDATNLLISEREWPDRT